MSGTDSKQLPTAMALVDKLKNLEARGAKILELDVTQDESMRSGVDRIICESGYKVSVRRYCTCSWRRSLLSLEAHNTPT
jgi:hypothetical protein